MRFSALRKIAASGPHAIADIDIPVRHRVDQFCGRIRLAVFAEETEADQISRKARAKRARSAGGA